MRLESSLRVLNEMEAAGVIGRYAIGGAVAAFLYIEPGTTFDLDAFIALEPFSDLYPGRPSGRSRVARNLASAPVGRKVVTVPLSLPRHAMNPISLTDLYRAKAERRGRLAALPIDEKVRIMEDLQIMGRTLRAARQQLEPSTPAPAIASKANAPKST